MHEPCNRPEIRSTVPQREKEYPRQVQLVHGGRIVLTDRQEEVARSVDQARVARQEGLCDVRQARVGGQHALDARLRPHGSAVFAR